MSIQEMVRRNPNFSLLSDDELRKYRSWLSDEKKSKEGLDTIIRMLYKHDMIFLGDPLKPEKRIEIRDHLLCDDGELMIFTNGDDCEVYGRLFGAGRPYLRNNPLSIGVMPYQTAVEIANKYQLNLHIDMLPGRYSLCYDPKANSHILYFMTNVSPAVFKS